MRDYEKVIVFLLVSALLVWPILIWLGISAVTFLWYLAWSYLCLGLMIAALGILIEVIPVDGDGVGNEEAEGLIAFFSILSSLVFIVPAASTFLIFWLFDLAPEGVAEWIRQLGASPISSWVIFALLLIGLIWSVVSLVTPTGKRH
jgi:hypothetical protein